MPRFPFQSPHSFLFVALICVTGAAGFVTPHASQAQAQESDPSVGWDLDRVFLEAQRLTLKRRSFLAAKEKSQAEIDELKSQALPQVALEVDGAYLNASPIGAGDAEARPGGDDRLEGGRYSWRFQAGSPVFGFGRLRNVFVLADKQLNVLDLTQAIEERRYKESLLQAFNNAVLAQNDERVAAADLKTRSKLLEFVKVEFEGGARPKVDLLQARASVAAARAAISRAQAQAQSQAARLASLLDLPIESPPQLRSDLSVTGSFFDNLDEEPKDRLELKLSRTSTQLADIEVDYQRSTRWPILSVFGNISSEVNTALPPTQVGDPPSPLEEASFPDLVDPDRFTYTAGVSLKWTLFEGFAIPARSEKAQAALIQSRTDTILGEREQKIARQETAANLRAAGSGLEAAQDAAAAAQLLATQAESDYRAGQISLRERLEIQDDLVAAQKDLFAQWSQRLLVATQFKIVRGIPLHTSQQNGKVAP